MKRGRKMKRLSILLVAAMLFSLWPEAVFAEGPQEIVSITSVENISVAYGTDKSDVIAQLPSSVTAVLKTQEELPKLTPAFYTKLYAVPQGIDQTDLSSDRVQDETQINTSGQTNDAFVEDGANNNKTTVDEAVVVDDHKNGAASADKTTQKTAEEPVVEQTSGFSDDETSLKSEAFAGNEEIPAALGTGNTGGTVEVEVTWSCDNYQAEIAGDYTFTMVLTDDTYIYNGDPIEVIVTVKEKPSVLYVAEAGNDETGSGSEEEPYATIGFAIDAAQGDSITINVIDTADWGMSNNWQGKAVTVIGQENAVLNIGESLAMQGDLKLDNIGIRLDKQALTIHAQGHRLETTETVTTVDQPDNYYSMVVFADGGELVLCGGRYAAVYGGGDRESVEVEQVTITLGGKAIALRVYGGSLMGSLKAEQINITLESGAQADIVFGGSGRNTEKDEADVNIWIKEGAQVGRAVYGGCDQGALTGDTTIHIDGTVAQGGRVDIIESGVVGGGYFGSMEGDAAIYVGKTGVIHGVYGGCQFSDLVGNVTIDIQGQVDYWLDDAIGSSGDEPIGGVVMGGGFHGGVSGDVAIDLGQEASAYCVAAGSDNGAVKGQTQVAIAGHILTLGEDNKKADRMTRYSGDVYGGGYTDNVDDMGMTTVAGGTHVYIAPTAVIEGSVYGGASFAHTAGTEVIVEGTVLGDVFAGGATQDGDTYYKGKEVLGYVDGDASVTLRGEARVRNVYAGGLMCNVWGNASITMAGEAAADDLYGCGKFENGRWYKNAYHTYGPVINYVKQNAVITIKDNAQVKDSIYGYQLLNDERAVVGQANVLFDGAKGSFKCVVNADQVQVTDRSAVTIDNAKQDAKQFINVSDLTIDQQGQLTLKANAHILGNYRGDKQSSGTLRLPAGKKLTADGTVTLLTAIRIFDADGIIPAEGQVYVISGLGSTTTDGDFAWKDQRNGVKMAWKANDDKTTQWWLVKAPDVPPTPGTDPGSDPDPAPTPSKPIVLPDNEPPLAETPIIDIPAEVVIPEQEVPLAEVPADNPKTGAGTAGKSSVWAVLLAAGALGIIFRRQSHHEE